MSRFECDDEHDLDFTADEKRKTRRPQRFKILLHNDNYTTMEFVVHVLRRHFHKSEGEATQIMLQVHHRGLGVAGIYPREIAETKVAEVTDEARTNGMPLMATTEAE